MELCTGGSLFDILDAPENSNGIEENEFKQVLTDVGMLLSEVIQIFITDYR